MELSLDEIITQTKGNRRGGATGFSRGRGRGRGRGGRPIGFGGAGRGIGGGMRGAGRRNLNFRRSGNADGVWAHDKFMDMNGARTRSGGVVGGGNARGGTKLVIGNLHFAVSEADLRELFGEFGPIVDATINYDMSGRSLGKADLIFQKRTSAQAAILKYSGIPLDGRPMDIQWASSTGLSAPPSRILNRVTGGRVGGGRGSGGILNKAAGGRGGRGTGRGRGGRNSQTKPPTAEELDAELDAYVRQNTK